MNQSIIAIDGPAGAGKGTVAQKVAEKLKFLYIDTGAMYRAVTLDVYNKKVDMNNPNAITAAAKECDIKFKISENGKQIVILNEKDVTEDIRSTDISRLVAPICAVAGVRNYLVNLQKKYGETDNLVMEGRDIGTVVFPEATLKIYLTASIDERARRRYNQLIENGIDVSLENVKNDMAQRDLLDSSREHSPLKKASDAILIESDSMSIEDVVNCIIELYKTKTQEK